MSRKYRHHIHRVIHRRHFRKGHPVEAEICVTETTAIRDAAAIIIALVILGAIACFAEHALNVNADVAYGVATSCGGHPLTVFMRKALATVF